MPNSDKKQEIQITNEQSKSIQEIVPPIEPPKFGPVATKPIYHAPWSVSFYGEGSKYFVIRLINAIFQLITFNFYYPWAKAAKLDYLYQQTEFAGSRFKFHGTGREMFIGYLKMLVIIMVIEMVKQEIIHATYFH